MSRSPLAEEIPLIHSISQLRQYSPDLIKPHVEVGPRTYKVIAMLATATAPLEQAEEIQERIQAGQVQLRFGGTPVVLCAEAPEGRFWPACTFLPETRV